MTNMDDKMEDYEDTLEANLELGELQQQMLSAQNVTSASTESGSSMHRTPDGSHVTLSLSLGPSTLRFLGSSLGLPMAPYLDYKWTGGQLILQLEKKSSTTTES